MALGYIHLPAGSEPPPLEVEPFRAVLIAEQAVDAGWRDKSADWLVATGCLYFIAWGADCETWHDSVDRANLRMFDYGEIPDDRFVMTTWHSKEPLSEALWFAGQCANHPSIDLEQTILVHVAEENCSEKLIRKFREAQD